MGATPVCQITAAGIIRPDFSATLTYEQTSYRAIYGADINLDPATQDGQMMALLASGIHDTNGETEATYHAFSPSTAQGEGLSSLVKLNGIRRKAPTYSTCDFLNVGQFGAAVTGGVIRDDAGYSWALPDFTFPLSGQITVTATCTTIGAIALSTNAVDTANGKGSIATPQLGWQSAVNLSAAATGQPVESDSQLRQRQSVSVALPSQTILGGLVGALQGLTGVTRLRAYDNDTNQSDANGIPGHGISIVVDGGDANAIASMIALKKGAAGTYGSTVVPVTDDVGITRNIAFFRPSLVPISYGMTIKPLTGYTLAVEAQIQQALSDWTNALGIGNSVLLSRAYAPADLVGMPTGNTFEIIPNSLTVSRDGLTPTAADAVLLFNEAATCTPSNVMITYVSQDAPWPI